MPAAAIGGMAVSEPDGGSPSVLQTFARVGSRNFSCARSPLQSYSQAQTAEELYQAQDVQVTRERCRAAVLGALVADAAGTSVQRMSLETLESLAADAPFQRSPEFFVRTAEDVLQVGGLSPLGVANLPLLQALLFHGGFDGPHTTSTVYDFFKQYQGEKTFVSQRFVTAVDQQASFPVGLSVNTCECLAKVPILVARYAGKPEVLSKLRDAVRMQQHTTDVLLCSLALGRILERVVLGCSVLEALTWAQEPGVMEASVQRHIQAVLKSTAVPHSVFVAKHGRSHRLPGAFVASLHAAAVASSYEDGVRQTLKAGGACCARAQVVGALLAAERGMDAIPAGWQQQVTKWGEYQELTEKLVRHRTIITIGQPPRTS